MDVFWPSQIIKTLRSIADDFVMFKIVNGRRRERLHSLYRRPSVEQLYIDISKLHESVTSVRLNCADPAIRCIAALLEDDLIDLLSECAAHTEPNPWWNGRAEFDSFLLRVETISEEVGELERHDPAKRDIVIEPQPLQF